VLERANERVERYRDVKQGGRFRGVRDALTLSALASAGNNGVSTGRSKH
jgi:hypothetical protein